jgi:hypothetical protein
MLASACELGRNGMELWWLPAHPVFGTVPDELESGPV